MKADKPAENPNPYAIFGVDVPVFDGNYKLEKNDCHNDILLFVIENFEEGSLVKRLEHNPRTGKIQMFDAYGNLVGNASLKNYEFGWISIDPLAGMYYSISPYAYVANNPIRFIDPTGMKIEGDTAAVNDLESQAQAGVAREKKTQARLGAKFEDKRDKGKSVSGVQRRIDRSIFRQGQYQSTINEIGVLRASDNIYRVDVNYSGGGDSDGFASYGGTTAEGNHIFNLNVTANYAKNGGLAHELLHGYQFERGQVDFDSRTGGPGLLYDIGDEIAAFTRQLVFTGSRQMYGVNESYVRGLSNTYKRLPGPGLNLNTPAGLVNYRYTGVLYPDYRPYTMSNPYSIHNKR